MFERHLPRHGGGPPTKYWVSERERILKEARRKSDPITVAFLCLLNGNPHVNRPTLVWARPSRRKHYRALERSCAISMINIRIRISAKWMTGCRSLCRQNFVVALRFEMHFEKNSVWSSSWFFDVHLVLELHIIFIIEKIDKNRYPIIYK